MNTPLFAQVLGQAWRELPHEIRDMHDTRSEHMAEGHCTVERSSGVLANMVCTLFGFPTSGTDVSVSVHFRARNRAEVWTRRFNGHILRSSLSPSRHGAQHLISERFGPVAYVQALVWDNGHLWYEPRRWSVFGLRLPLWLGPRSHAYETVMDGRFHFHVEISHPLMGLLIRYQGWLVRSPD